MIRNPLPSLIRAATAALGISTVGLALLAQPASALEVVRFGTDAYTSGSQVWIAKDKGIFEKYGIDATITTFATGVETLDAVLTGRNDFGIALDFPITLRMQSKQMVVLASVFGSTPGFHKLVVTDAIKEPADLKGKRFAIAKGTAQNLVTVKYLEMKGIAAKDVELIPFQTLVEIVAALKAGRIDAAFVWADGVAQSTAIPGMRILTDDSEAKLNQSGYIAASVAFTKAKPEVVKNVLKALDEATTFIKTNPDEAAALVSARNKAPVESTKRLLAQTEFRVSLSQQNADAFAVILAFASDVVKTPINFDTAVDTSFLRAALPNNITIGK